MNHNVLNFHKVCYEFLRAGVVELVDTPDLGSGDESRGGSSPFARTKIAVRNTRKQVKVLDYIYFKAKWDIIL